MVAKEPVYHSIVEDELSTLARASRTYNGILFPPNLPLDELDLTESRFDRCMFRVPTIRSADFSRSAFKDCRFEPTRFASCKFAGAHLVGCTLFDLQQKKGCTFAFCDLQAAELAKCNFTTSSFERCDLYNLRAVECSFRGAQFHQSTFTKMLSKRSTLTRAFFDKCNFSFADLSRLSLQSCEFLSCKFSEASFIDSDLTDAKMLTCTLDRAEWDRAKLKNADLRKSQISGLSLAVLSDYAGLTISESEQTAILEQLGVKVRPE